MRLPIALGMGWPERVPDAAPVFDWSQAMSWDFGPLDAEAFPAVALARQVGAAGRHGAGGLQRRERGVRRGVLGRKAAVLRHRGYGCRCGRGTRRTAGEPPCRSPMSSTLRPGRVPVPVNWRRQQRRPAHDDPDDVLGIVVFVLGLLFSIAWHELGHLSTAKIFGIRVPQYMVGFGPTIFSRRRGETEYGLKAVPLGGYIRMIGMFPPGEDGSLRKRSTSPFRGMIEDARAAAFEELQPGDEKRLFYTRTPWKRVIVMFAGPFMNLILAVVIFLGVLMSFGINTQTTTVSSVSDCVIPASAERATSAPRAPRTRPPRQRACRPGDKIVAFDGTNGRRSGTTLQRQIRDTTGPADDHGRAGRRPARRSKPI